MQRPPRACIALNGNHPPPEAVQGVEARRQKKSCHEASEDCSCARERRQARETSARGYERQRGGHGHDLVLTYAPLEEKALAREQVEEERAKLS